MAALQARKLGRCVNADVAAVLVTGGGSEDIANLDCTALTGSGGDDESASDYGAILDGSATNAANVCWIDLTDDVGATRFSQLLVYPLWCYTSSITLDTPPVVSFLGELPAANNASSRLVPSSLHPSLAPTEDREFVRILDVEGNHMITLLPDIGSCRAAGSKRIWRGLPVRMPVWGITSILGCVNTAGVLSNASGKLMLAVRGICTG